MYGACAGEGRTQAWARPVLGVSERTFRRYAARYGAEGGRRSAVTGRVAEARTVARRVSEVAALEALYRQGYEGLGARGTSTSGTGWGSRREGGRTHG